MESPHAHRKNEHLSLAEKLYATAHETHPFDDVRLIHRSLPELTADEVSLSTRLTRTIDLAIPFYIEAMTGGSQQSLKINQQLARVAAQSGLAMACGSQSVALKHADSVASFEILRAENPDGILIANLSANATLTQVRDAVDMIAANAIELHINAAQELIMPEGERSFKWLNHLADLVAQSPVPVIVKEVGFGMAAETFAQLRAIGVQTVNVSGRGGTNFAMIENRRNHTDDFSDLADWGLTTPESLLESQPFQQDMTVIASGGVTSPLDVIKSGVLGASAVGVAGYFLDQLIQNGPEALTEIVRQWQVEVQRLLLLCGCQSFDQLPNVPYVLSSELNNYLNQRKKS